MKQFYGGIDDTMVNKVPIIKVKKEIKRIINTNPYIKDNVCIIGCFETDENYLTPTPVSTIEKARETYGTDTTIDANAALEQILGDNTVSNVLIVNATTTTGSGDNPTYQRNLSETKLKDCITALDLINFDILFVADNLSDAYIEIVDKFAEDRFENKMPFGYVTGLSRANVSAYTTTSALLGDFCYAAVIQRLELGEDELSVIESGAFICKQIATLNVGESLTAKTIPEITGINTADVYTFEDESDGATLTGNGYLLFRLINATTNTYEAVNSANHNGLDVYMSRVRDYIVNEFALRQFLGRKNNSVTLSEIEMECNRLLQMFVSDLGLVENITYAVQKQDAETVNVIINSIEFAGVITEIDVFITIEVI